MTSVSPEQRQEIEQAGGEAVRMEDPVTHEFFVVIEEEVHKRLEESIAIDHSDLSLHEFEEFLPNP